MTDPNENQILFTGEALTYLRESSGWGTFLSIVGFLYSALIICMGFFAGTIYGGLQTVNGPMGDMVITIISGIYIGIGVLFIFPSLYLFRFSQEVKISASRKSTQAMTTALRNLKSMFKFMGIFTAISIGLMVILTGAAMIGTLMR